MSVRLAPFVSRLEGIFNIRNLSIRDCLMACIFNGFVYHGGELEGGWAILFGCGNVIKA